MNLPWITRLMAVGLGIGAAFAARASTDAGMAAAPGAIVVSPGRTTTVVVHDVVGTPLERQPGFLVAAPTYPRAIASDRDQRWVEAVAFYQQAVIDVGAAAETAPPQTVEYAAFKVELERRRSRALAEDAAAESPTMRRPPGSQTGPARLPPIDRARLLRHKLMAVRAATGAAPASLRAATLAALTRAREDAERADSGRAPGSPSAAAEARMLACATLAVTGDPAAARAELARVRPEDRSDPARALPLAACQAALGWRDDALGSLAVAVGRLGPSSRFLPGASREIQTANDWDTLRSDPRFARLFR